MTLAELVKSLREQRRTSQDGLQTLHERGGLERQEYEAGLMYRRAYETLAAGPRSNPCAQDGFAEIRSFRARKLSEWEALSATGRELWVLRLVAGQGRTINSLGAGAGSRKANAAALTSILTAIAKERGLR